MIQGKRDSKGIFTDEEELSSKGMTILQHLWSNNASTNRSTQTKDLPHNPLRVHEPLAIEKLPFVDGHPTISQSDKSEAGIVRNISTLNGNSNISQSNELHKQLEAKQEKSHKKNRSEGMSY